MPKERGNNFYNVSYTTDSESEANTLRTGDEIRVKGTWEISKIKQKDGFPSSYHFIKATEIEKITDGEDGPW